MYKFNINFLQCFPLLLYLQVQQSHASKCSSKRACTGNVPTWLIFPSFSAYTTLSSTLFRKGMHCFPGALWCHMQSQPPIRELLFANNGFLSYPPETGRCSCSVFRAAVGINSCQLLFTQDFHYCTNEEGKRGLDSIISKMALKS